MLVFKGRNKANSKYRSPKQPPWPPQLRYNLYTSPHSFPRTRTKPKVLQETGSTWLKHPSNRSVEYHSNQRGRGYCPDGLIWTEGRQFSGSWSMASCRDIVPFFLYQSHLGTWYQLNFKETKNKKPSIISPRKSSPVEGIVHWGQRRIRGFGLHSHPLTDDVAIKSELTHFQISHSVEENGFTCAS